MKLFELFATLGIDKTGFDQGVDSAVGKGEGAQKKIGNAFGLLKKALVAAGVVVAVKKIGEAFVNMGEKADTIDETSQKLGLSRKAYQEWGYVLSQNGGNIESFGVGMKTLQNAMVQGTEATNAAFTALGLSADKLKSMSPEDALAETIKAFQAMPEGAEKSALAMDLFGKQGMDLLPTLNMTAEATDALKQRANELGLVLSDEAIDAGGKFADNMATLKLGLAAVGTNIIAKLMPAISKFIEKILPLISRILPKFADAFGTIFEAVMPIAEVLLDVFVMALEWVADNIETLIPIVGALGAAFLVISAILNPIPIAIAAIVAAIVYLATNWSTVWSAISSTASAAWDAIVSVWTAVSTWFMDNVITPIVGFFVGLWDAISTAASDAWDAIVLVWTAVTTWFNDNIIVPISTAFVSFWLVISGLFSTLWSWIKGIWNGAKKWFDDTVINPLVTAFTSFWDGLKKTAKDTWDAIVGWIQDAIDKVMEFLGIKGNPYDSDGYSGIPFNPFSIVPIIPVPGGAVGKSYIPYDNYLMRLHEGEAVLPKAEATEYRKGSASSGVSDAALANLGGAIISAISGMSFVGEFDGRELYRAVRKVGLA